MKLKLQKQKILTLLTVMVLFTGCSFFEKRKEEQVLKDYKNMPLVYISQTDFPVYGNPKAKVKFDIFFDPWCGPCRSFEMSVIKPLLKTPYAEKVSIAFHLFPLGDNMYKDDRVASLLHLEMANRGLFTEFRDKILQDNIKKYDQMLFLAESLAKEKLPISLLEKNNAQKLQKSVNIVRNLRLNHTPTLFVDNKEITTPSLENLKVLIDKIPSLKTS